MIKRIYCLAKISFHKGICKSLKLAHGNSTQRLESFCEKLDHMESVRWLRHTCAYYDKFYREHPEYKTSMGLQSSYPGGYLESIKSRPIIEGYEVESNFGPSPPEP